MADQPSARRRDAPSDAPGHPHHLRRRPPRRAGRHLGRRHRRVGRGTRLRRRRPELVPDETGRIAATLAAWADADAADLILTTGGTGLTARDVTPEATRAVLDKEAPGIAEALRMAVYPRFPRAALSRGTAGVRGAHPDRQPARQHRRGPRRARGAERSRRARRGPGARRPHRARVRPRAGYGASTATGLSAQGMSPPQMSGPTPPSPLPT